MMGCSVILNKQCTSGDDVMIGVIVLCGTIVNGGTLCYVKLLRICMVCIRKQAIIMTLNKSMTCLLKSLGMKPI